MYADRGRAEAFGLAADDYDRYRPRYPRPLITELIRRSHMRALDVGADYRGGFIRFATCVDGVSWGRRVTHVTQDLR